MKTILAWFVLETSYTSRRLYQLISTLGSARFARGVNPLAMAKDGLVLIVVGILMVLAVVVGALWFLVSVPFKDRRDYKALKTYVKQGRFYWRTGRIKDEGGDE